MFRIHSRSALQLSYNDHTLTFLFISTFSPKPLLICYKLTIFNSVKKKTDSFHIKELPDAFAGQVTTLEGMQIFDKEIQSTLSRNEPFLSISDMTIWYDVICQTSRSTISMKKRS
jgi:hypothetical protein